jgi:hypothetical protein
MNDDRATPVTPLRSLHNYRVAEGNPDVRGWDVLGADGKKIGEVDDLLVDTEGLRVLYLDVTVGLDALPEQQAPENLEADGVLTTPGLPPLGGPFTAEAAMGGLAPLITETVVRSTLSDEENRLTSEHHQGVGTRHVLIPIGNARLDADHDRVLVEGLRADDAAGLPDSNGQNLDRDYETTLRRFFDQTYTPQPERDFYSHDLYDQSRFYAPRRQRTDGVQGEAGMARTAGLEPGDTRGGGSDRAQKITGELDRAVDAPDHNVTRDETEAALPVRGRS